MLNYTNPENRVCLALRRHTGTRVVGLCHSVAEAIDDCARTLGRPRAEIDVHAAGVNHFTWFLSIRDARDGSDLMPEFRRRTMAADPEPSAAHADARRATGTPPGDRRRPRRRVPAMGGRGHRHARLRLRGARSTEPRRRRDARGLGVRRPAGRAAPGRTVAGGEGRPQRGRDHGRRRSRVGPGAGLRSSSRTTATSTTFRPIPSSRSRASSRTVCREGVPVGAMPEPVAALRPARAGDPGSGGRGGASRGRATSRCGRCCSTRWSTARAPPSGSSTRSCGRTAPSCRASGPDRAALRRFVRHGTRPSARLSGVIRRRHPGLLARPCEGLRGRGGGPSRVPRSWPPGTRTRPAGRPRASGARGPAPRRTWRAPGTTGHRRRHRHHEDERAPRRHRRRGRGRQARLHREGAGADARRGAGRIVEAVERAGVKLTVSLPRLAHGYTLGDPGRPRVRSPRDGDAGPVPAVARRRRRSALAARPSSSIPPTPAAAPWSTSVAIRSTSPACSSAACPRRSAEFGRVTGHAVDDNAVAVLRHRTGALGIAETGFVNPSSPFTIEIHGTKGSLLYGTPEPRLLVGDGSRGRDEAGPSCRSPNPGRRPSSSG